MVRFGFRSEVKKNGAVSVGIAASVAIMAIIGADSSTYAKDNGDPGPPRTGWMEKFEPAAKPVPAPETVFTDAKGTQLTLKNFRGRIVLVNLWATWCGPCVREMPSLLRLHEKLKGPDFVVIALSEDRKGWEKIGPFRDKLNLQTLPFFHDVNSKMMFATKARGLPTTLLISRDGRELGRLAGLAEWDSDEAMALIRHYMKK